MPASFFDSNVLVYLIKDDDGKAQRAEQLLLEGGTISVQVLNEIACVGRRKVKMPWADLHEFLELVRSKVRVVPQTIETHAKGLALSERYGLSIYDAMIAAAALIDGCDTLWSEDMHYDLHIEGGPRIENPFR